MRQRKKEMHNFKEMKKKLGGQKYQDEGRGPDLGGNNEPFIGRGWKTIDEVGKNMEVSIHHDFKADHVSQGELGDCYFLTSLSVMAQHPGLIQKLIITNHYNP